MMQHNLKPVLSHQPRVFRYSLDWRFLVPMVDMGKIHVLVENNPEFSQTLTQVGIPESNQLSFLELRENTNRNLQVLVIPFGPAVHWIGAEDKVQIEFYEASRRLLAPGGYLLVGFNRARQFRDQPSPYYPSTPGRMVTRLKRAGFQSVRVFGAMPNLNIPQYIFELDSRTAYFALQNRFRRKKMILYALRALAATAGVARVLNFLPCYFAVATV